ncbi:RND family efflux transporter, MFP subunit [Desulfacinum hydrothermale DSM 13146]|uniref:RND family efflux transporter, MFP subunit n=1 Tax=Desulfacinum hydrothermale DSM 13146 TaxID=1121390 RepID=A0A1W1XND3_9BACT|nr:efflux RND transporter periplasmic adaptor subunit [Desulfacinum hydrothermale]SMC25018.1 RND family efflux transporter, MFP subunit [Desulfacinum hydrothermale DSM 13146]
MTARKKEEGTDRRVFFRIAVCVAILAVGIAAMAVLSKLKKPPVEAVETEQALKVQAMRAVYEDVPVVLRGHGNAAPVDTATLSSQVSGTVVFVHPRLDVGEIIPKGDVLFRIDPRDYETALEQAQASVAQWTSTVERLRREYQREQARLGPLTRTRDLARSEFERLRRLYTQNKVGTRSGVEAAEKAYQQALDQLNVLRRSLAVYPQRIQEAESNLRSAQAQREQARIRLERCTVKAPFDGRVTSVSVEIGQYLAPGTPAVSLADDSMLEIAVSLDSRDARRWLLFDRTSSRPPVAWFQNIRHVPCRIRWTEDPSGHEWTGTLHRVMDYDRKTRTVTVAVRVTAQEAARTTAGGLPLVAGMFCSVDIPGKTMERVVRVPRWAVTFDNTVYLAVNKRLKTVDVQVARIQGDEAFLSDGVQEGDMVIVTRLVSPLEDMLLEVEPADRKAARTAREDKRS